MTRLRSFPDFEYWMVRACVIECGAELLRTALYMPAFQAEAARERARVERVLSLARDYRKEPPPKPWGTRWRSASVSASAWAAEHNNHLFGGITAAANMLLRAIECPSAGTSVRGIYYVVHQYDDVLADMIGCSWFLRQVAPNAASDVLTAAVATMQLLVPVPAPNADDIPPYVEAVAEILGVETPELWSYLVAGDASRRGLGLGLGGVL